MAPESEDSPRVPWLPVSEGAQATPPTPREPLTPTKPTVPAWIRQDAVPEPVDDEEAAVIAPFSPPSAEELLPPLGVETTSQGDVPSEEPSDDAVRRLGESAVASATLSAAGAPTPLGGVPRVPAEGPIEPPELDASGEKFTPQFEDDGHPTNGEKADALAAAIVAGEQARLAEHSPALDAGAAYTPVAFAGDEPNPSDEASTLTPMETPIDEVPEESVERKRRFWWLWILVALIVAGGITTAVILLNRPEPTVVPGATVTMPPAEPTIEPTTAPTATPFQAAMPPEVGTYALVGATPIDPADAALTAGRIADGVELTYSSGANTMTVTAYQYYNEADATTMFVEFVGEDATTQPVEAGGAVVGESAIVTSPEPGMVWRNGTSLFILTGPPSELADFYALFGL